MTETTEISGGGCRPLQHHSTTAVPLIVVELIRSTSSTEASRGAGTSLGAPVEATCLHALNRRRRRERKATLATNAPKLKTQEGGIVLHLLCRTTVHALFLLSSLKSLCPPVRKHPRAHLVTLKGAPVLEPAVPRPLLHSERRAAAPLPRLRRGGVRRLLQDQGRAAPPWVPLQGTRQL